LQHANVGNSYILFNQIYNTAQQNTSQNHINSQNLYFPPNSITNQQITNNSSITTSQFIPPILQNSLIQNQLINHQYSSYPPVFYYLTPPVSPSIYLPQTFHQFQQHNDNLNNNLNIIPTIEFIKIVIKGVPSNITTFDIIDTLKDCGEVSKIII